MEKRLYDLTINEELLKVAPPLSDTEKSVLTEDLMEHGCVFPLVVWNGVIVDGHNRYSICHENGIPFAIEEMDFDSLTDAKLWIVKNQLGRRNLTPFQRCELIYPFETELLEEAEKRRIAKRAAGVPTLAHEKRTRDVMADLAEVSHGTWDKAKKIILEGEETMKVQLRTGEMKIHTAFMKLKKKDKPEREGEQKNKEKTEKEEEEKNKEKPEPAIHIDEPMVFDPMPDMEDKSEFTPEDFSDVEVEVENCIRDFMMNFNAAMKWIGKHHVSKKNENAVKEILKEGYEAAVEVLSARFNELKGE